MHTPLALLALTLLGLAVSVHPAPYREDVQPLPERPDDHAIHNHHNAESTRADDVIHHWTPDRIANARPRDMSLSADRRGSLSTVPMASDVANGEWESNWGGAIQTAVGRIYFEFGSSGYVCSGTVAKDTKSDRSIIITAAHCVYDEQADKFATNVLFIPNQAGTSGQGTDTNCDNDPLGCWAPTFGVADTDWADRIFPENIPWDYAYYVVPATGAHAGPSTRADGTAISDNLEEAAGSLDVSFAAPPSVFTYALGYSYSHDPNFMHCAQQLGTQSQQNFNALWLGGCGLSGGASGGPWIQGGAQSHTIISVNSWGFHGAPGMGAPQLDSGNNGHAADVFALAQCGSDPGPENGLLWSSSLADPCVPASEEPTEAPTNPTEAPTNPTEAPTNPTEAPTNPTEAPTNPTEAPTNPTEAPTNPTEAPTNPTEAPTKQPTEPPTAREMSRCKPWCTKKSRSAWAWQRLCNRGACAGCAQCDTCMAFCNISRPRWSKKCLWSECGGCQSCT